jgi:lysozyme
MTLYGVDISNFQTGLDIGRVAAEGFSWIAAKVSEGDYYTDPTWPGFRAAATAAGIPIIGYHYAVASCPPGGQVAAFVRAGGGNRVMIDFEDTSGTITDYWALVNAFAAAGITVALSYIPQWYWSRIGSPDLSQVPGLVSSAYPGGTGYASDIYTNGLGDTGTGWASYGAGRPVIWQFTDQASVAGYHLDADAFRGTSSDLVALLTGTQGALMALTDDQQTDLYAKVQAIWAQLLGPQGHGWPQLGSNTGGATLTPVDAVANLETQVTALGTQVGALATVVSAVATKVGA